MRAYGFTKEVFPLFERARGAGVDFITFQVFEEHSFLLVTTGTGPVWKLCTEPHWDMEQSF
jgi:hypothetical protein